MNQYHTIDSGLHRVDLNLIVAFDMLVRERNVTRAAERVGVTQSAMSHSLRRLREMFGDPLLVRGNKEMVLTPRAEQLIVPLRSSLVTIERALDAPTFDPNTADRTLRISSPDIFNILVVPKLLKRLRVEAPSVNLTVAPFGDGATGRKLATGELDVSIVAIIADVDPATVTSLPESGLLRRTLLRDSMSCFLRADHVALRGRGRRRRVTLDTYADASHALVSPSGEGPGVVDRVLEATGRRRRIALRNPDFYSALGIVAETDLVLTAPSALAGLLPTDTPVVAVALPFDLPDHGVAMVWHERFSSDPFHQWARTMLAEVAGALELAGAKVRGRAGVRK